VEKYQDGRAASTSLIYSLPFSIFSSSLLSSLALSFPLLSSLVRPATAWRRRCARALVLPCRGGEGARDPAPMAEARGRRCPAWAAEPRTGGCGPAPAAEARGPRGQAPAVEPRASGAARRLRQRARRRERLGAGRRRYSGGRGRPTVAEPQAGAASSGSGRPGAGSLRLGEGLRPAPPPGS